MAIRIHTPVLSNEIVRNLKPKPGDIFIDATADGGGHSTQIVKYILPGGRLFALDADTEILSIFRKRVRKKKYEKNITVVEKSFVHLKETAKKYAINGKVDAILFDLGLSSWHLEQSGRGFSYLKNEPLDMRFSKKTKKTAAEIVNTSSFQKLTELFKKYGEESRARQIAKIIVSARKRKPLKTTGDLTKLIDAAKGGRARTFQALRIAVNNELETLYNGLQNAFSLLAPSGKLAVISYHSLEDRIVKRVLRKYTKSAKAKTIIEFLKPTRQEISKNKQSRSATLRIIQKL